MKKSPPQAKNFWGPFFQKFDGFWKKIRKINGFLAVLTVFSASTTKKSPPQAKNLGTPFFAPKIFRGLFHFRPRTPLKKFGDDVCSSQAEPKNFLKIFMTQLEHEIFLSFMRKILNFFLQNLQKIFYFSKNFWLILARRADEL